MPPISPHILAHSVLSPWGIQPQGRLSRALSLSLGSCQHKNFLI